MDYSAKRKDFVAWVRACLMGPAVSSIQSPGDDQGNHVLAGIPPLNRYHTGILFPIIKGAEGLDPAFDDPEDDDEPIGLTENRNDSKQAESTQKKRRYIPPSSVGFSFFVMGEKIELNIYASAVRYIPEGDRGESGRFVPRKWIRNRFESKSSINFQPPKLRQKKCDTIDIFEPDKAPRAKAVILWRPNGDGWITTVTLCNTREISAEKVEEFNIEQNETSLFEVNLKCIIVSGEVGAYPRVDMRLLTEEEQEIEFQYKNRQIYAVGHGAAADWTVKNGRVTEIRAEFMPSVEVPQVTADVGNTDDETLSLKFLSGCGGNANGVFEGLERFASGYEEWIDHQLRKVDEVAENEYERDAATRIVSRMRMAISRMRQGIAFLRNTPLAARAFVIANQAMYRQMAQTDRSQGKNIREYRWRPFQLAFLLTVLESVLNEDSDFRDTVDLIWFPTGGGKTEAYLGLIAIQIIWRRLTSRKSGGGTTVLMRYTLRLLTAQQYLRAARLICALELIRRETPELGAEPITIGMWVGEAASPNTFAAVQKIVDSARLGNGSPPLKLVLNSCPWCRSPFKVPDNYLSTSTRFHFLCTNRNCDFGASGSEILPCNVVDEALYDAPPTLLVATIDKFARLTWEDRTNGFFGKNENRPPELIIQDELHLIAGALGSVAGLYEAALDTVLTRRGIHPKYIASTATIRMAEQQVQRLYGKSVAVFPPPGLSCDDSFFARTVPTETRPGRLYVGYFTPYLNRQRCMAPLAASLLAAPQAVFGPGQQDWDLWLEAWWTLVIYHGSLKGVGNSHNAFNTGVREYYQRYVEEVMKAERQNGSETMAPRIFPNIAQLTSISDAQENARTFSRLERTRDDPACLDAVLATNMISVGLDVARLALMIVNGQPLTTAEYIQTTSRVGRSDVPGIAFANYYRDQARSLSHYESFRSYHESFYRFVEPNSLTPYTYQARLRALHAALIIAIRHSCSSLLPNNAADRFDPQEDGVRTVIETLKRRCAAADPERGPETKSHIDTLIAEWASEVQRCKETRIQLKYHAPDKDRATERLIYNHDDKIIGLWATLQSMRNVENTALMKQRYGYER